MILEISYSKFSVTEVGKEGDIALKHTHTHTHTHSCMALSQHKIRPLEPERTLENIVSITLLHS